MRPDQRKNSDLWEAPVPDDIWDDPGSAAPVPENAYMPPVPRQMPPAYPAGEDPLQGAVPVPEDWGTETPYPDAVYEEEQPRRGKRREKKVLRARIAGENRAAPEQKPAYADPYGIPDHWGDDARVPGTQPAFVPAASVQDAYDIPVGWGDAGDPAGGHARLRPENGGAKAAPAPGDHPRARSRGNERYAEPPAGKPSGPSGHRWPWVLISLVCAALLIWMGCSLIDRYFISGEPAHRRRVEAVYGGRFPEGITVDGVAVGGMTREEAENALKADHAENTPQIDITVTIRGGGSYRVTSDHIPFYRNTAAVLNEALNLTRQGIADTMLSPVEYRYKKMEQIARNGAYYYTRVTYSRGDVQQVVQSIGAAETSPAVDATVAAFDFTTRTFVFTEEKSGRTIDTEALYAGLISMLDQGQYTGEVILEPGIVQPAVTKTKLMSTFSMIASFTTDTTDDPERNMNILLACEAVNGTVLGSGETFSFNACTGERTAAKGYMAAAAIKNGTTVDDIGGGVCQVSSTLFNAAALADMTITEHYAHTWPSSYVDKGRDATVNWPNLDFCFRNDKEWPVFIAAYYEGRKCTVEFYGVAPPAGETIELMSVVTRTEKPPAEAEYILNSSLPSGTQREVKKARTGYTVETYRIYKLNGVEYRRVKLFDSIYKMIRQVIEYSL